MTAYVDASVLLRIVLGQPNALPEWKEIGRGISSALLTVESLRTLDRLRLRTRISDFDLASRRRTILTVIDSLELIEIDAAANRAAQPAHRTGNDAPSGQRPAVAGVLRRPGHDDSTMRLPWVHKHGLRLRRTPTTYFKSSTVAIVAESVGVVRQIG